jgi:hypothetical protein
MNPFDGCPKDGKLKRYTLPLMRIAYEYICRLREAVGERRYFLACKSRELSLTGYIKDTEEHTYVLCAFILSFTDRGEVIFLFSTGDWVPIWAPNMYKHKRVISSGI